MRKLIIIVLLALFYMPSFAQLDSFKLSDFILPDYRRHSLDLRFNLDAKNNYSKNTDQDDRFVNNLTNTFSLGYSLNKFTRKNEQSINYYISNNLSFISNKGNYKSFNLYENQRISFGYNSSWYFSKKWFCGVGVEVTNDFSYYFAKSDSTHKSNKNDLTASLPISIGKGRLEPVQDARLAAYILEELNKENRLSRQPTNAEIMELANLIANLKNERYFDYRLQKIKEMEEVDKYLQSKGIIEKSDMRYFAIINDNWDNASGPTRLSGSRLSMGYSPFVIIYRDSKDYNPTTWNPDNIIHHRLFINYTYEKPKSLKLQKSFRSAIEYTRRIYQTKIPNSALNEDITDYYSAYTQYGIGFYPNSRTSVICNVGIDFHQSVGDFTNRDNYEYTINPYIGGSFYYYFSPQLRIDASARFSYSYTKHKNVSGDVISYPYYHESDNYLKIGFVYSIF